MPNCIFICQKARLFEHLANSSKRSNDLSYIVAYYNDGNLKYLVLGKVTMSFAEDLYFSLEANVPLLELVVPFLLLSFFVAVVLKKGKIFSSRQSTLIGAIMGLALVAPHALGRYPPCYDLVNIINEAITTLGLFVIGIIMFLIVLGFVGMKPKFESFSGLIFALMLGVVLFSFLSSGTSDPSCPRYDLEFLEFAMPYAIIIGILWGITRLLGGGAAPPRRPHPAPYHP